MAEWLPIIWGALLGVALMLYVVLNGFDLGIGILFPWGRDERERDVMMNSIAPMWDGNETWLVLAGGGLLAAFPLAYSVMMPALYIPVILMLFALIFRGVAFEFRFKSNRSRGVWDFAFTAGSTVAAFTQGLVLGALIQGFEVEGRGFAGGPLDWLTPFALMTGFALVCGYALLGACWLILKTEGELQAWARHAAQWLIFVVLGWIALVSLFTPITHPNVAERWFAWPNLLLLAPVPILTAAVAGALFYSLRRGAEWRPFLLTIVLFALGYGGIGISLWPYIVPWQLTFHEAAAQPESQLFLLAGALPLLPLILAYTAYNYWVFRGKTRPDAGYH